jgi:hypothetical protein
VCYYERLLTLKGPENGPADIPPIPPFLGKTNNLVGLSTGSRFSIG